MPDKRLELRIDSELLDRVDLWKASRTDVTNRSEAIRKLIEIGLQGIQRDDEEVYLTKGEELILRMLAQRWCDDDGDPVEPSFEMNPKVLFNALVKGQHWAINYGPIKPFWNDGIPSKNEVNFVFKTMFLWSYMIRVFEAAPEELKDLFTQKTGWTYLKFPGFHIEAEGKYYESMSFIIDNDIDGYGWMLEKYKSYEYLSHTLNANAYQKMLAKFSQLKNPWTNDEDAIKLVIQLVLIFKSYVKPYTD